MKGIRNAVFASAAVLGLGLSGYLLFTRDENPGSGSGSRESRAIEDLQTQVAALRKEISRMTGVSSTDSARAGAAEGAASASLEERLRGMEKSIASLESAMDGVNMEKASADRNALFAAAEGYLKADEYFEAGKYAIAGEGYLTFLQHNPNHADVRSVLKKARDAFLKAGYAEKAFWVNEEMMKKFPQHRANDLWEQANLEKGAGLYDSAVKHAAEAAELAPTPEERLWRRSYWAYYVQLRDGNDAGIAALRQVQQEIADAGFDANTKIAMKMQEKLVEWKKK
jgi:hypothetical protein